MSPFMQNGAADDFVKKNPNVNRVRLLVQVARGLEYMHTRKPLVIHGDLKADNILISDDGSACLSDFGLSRVHVEAGAAATPNTSRTFALTPITMAYHANFRWGAPEVLLGGRQRTPSSDIYSLGRLMAELLTGEIPFSHLPDCAIIQHVEAGTYDRPPEDSDAATCGLDDDMWGLILDCWDQDPLKRPSASQVVERLHRMPEPASVNPSWKPCVKAAGRDITTGGSNSSMSISRAKLPMNIDWLGCTVD
ncbi:hypothetical protein BOTBODRAFT_39488 [Botryobasidium botryosum FD-172 SS1]|uniref:Protein kinase domain-containing protein n=1 Tax=Botryobasidium botryosum (strain FD-172 SS1) TaxID=930990 RepID=A0A067LTZ3_BOTB1|nr:hypothetical protein BOTBODRAFT_39488 [Botryobasidium botryosum FD-172 SS1]